MLTITLRRLFRLGDIDGFLALGLEYFVQVILLVSLCQGVLHFPNSLVYGRILPGVAISVSLGQFFYGWLGYQQGKQQGRTDITALPSGINLISLLAFIFLIMLPVRTAAIAQGLSSDQAAELAWQSGLAACASTAVIKFIGIGFVGLLKRFIPLAAHLSTLGGISLTFIAMGFFLRTFAYPVVGLVPLGVILLAYFGRVKFAIPGG
ncbi:MAG: NCS2 family permease, partial [Leptolyngbyaceae bacterium]|nr:NCS2 family permease [Leptolyngbyaceae bacterium]